MPIKLNVYSSQEDLSEQDKTDIDKLYADHLQTQAAVCVEALLASDNASFYAARFNDRIVGGFIVIEEESTWHMHYLCVRKVTRRRRVAHDLMREAVKALKALPATQSRPMLVQTIEAPAAAAELTAFLLNEGFEKKGAEYHLALNA